jgi:GT2 family glycosyltransferase
MNKSKSQKIINEIYSRFHSIENEQYPWYLDPIKNGSITSFNSVYKVAFDHFKNFAKQNNIPEAVRTLFYQKDHFSIYALVQYDKKIPNLAVDNPNFSVSIVDNLDGAILLKISCISPKVIQEEKITLYFGEKNFCKFNLSWNIKWNIEENSNGKFSGWIFNVDNPLKPVTIAIFNNEINVKNIEATIERNDVAEVFNLPKGNYGFNEKIPVSRGIFRQRYYIYESQIELIETKKILYSNEYINNFNEKIVDHISTFESSNLIEKNYVKKIAELINDSTYIKYLGGMGDKIYYQLPSRSNEKSLSIIIPVYDGYDQVVKCIDSVLNSKTKLAIDVIVGYDNGPNPRVRQYLEGISDSRFNLIVHNENLGFVKNVNKIIKEKKYKDFLLLNADTIVSDELFDRLILQLNNDRTCASITPLSNNATIYSIYNLKTSELGLINDFLYKNFNRCVDVPVGNGFCMLINGDIYSRYGLFNEQRWGKGYGEEVDWCLGVHRSYGLKHVAYLGAFVYHEGSVSFGVSGMNLAVEKASKLIEEIYPGYNRSVQKYAINGSLNSEKIKVDILKSEVCEIPIKRKTLYISHGFGGGVEKYISDKISKLSSKDGYIIGRLIERDSESYWMFSGDEITDRYFSTDKLSGIANWFKAIRVDDISIEHLGHASPDEISLLIQNAKIPYKIGIHDYSYICPRVNLIDYDGNYCETQSSDVCEFCISKAGVIDASRSTFEKVMTVSNLRSSSLELLSKATAVSVPSISAKVLYNNIFKNIKFKVVPHHKERQFIKRFPTSIFSKTICIIGAISKPKGFLKYKEFCDYMEKYFPDFRIVFIGYTENDQIFKSNKNVIISGRYEQIEIKSLIEKYDPFCSLFLNIAPETFGYALSESLEHGLYPFYLNVGAIGDRLGKINIGSRYDSSVSVIKIAKDIVNYHKSLVVNL